MYKVKEGILTQQQADDTASFYDMSTEEYAAKNNWELQEGEPEGEPGKTKDPVQTANAGSETMTAGGDSISADTSLEQSETVNQGRQTQVKGTIVYEDDYLEKYAGKKTGKGNYPDTFEEYAKLNNAEITDMPFSTMLDEVEVTAEMSSETKSDKKQGENILAIKSDINPESAHASIVAKYFGMTDNFNLDYSDTTKKSKYYNNDNDANAREYLGETKYNQYKALLDSRENNFQGGDLTEKDLLNFDLDNVPQEFQDSVVKDSQRDAENVYLQSLTPEERKAAIKYTLPEELQQEFQTKQGERDAKKQKFEKQFGRPLLRDEPKLGYTRPLTDAEIAQGLIGKNMAALNASVSLEDKRGEVFTAEIENATKGIAEIDAKIVKYDAEIKRRGPENSRRLIEERNALATGSDRADYIAMHNNAVDGINAGNENLKNIIQNYDALEATGNTAIALGKNYSTLEKAAHSLITSTSGAFASVAAMTANTIASALDGTTIDEANVDLVRNLESIGDWGVNYNLELRKQQNGFAATARIEDRDRKGWTLKNYVAHAAADNAFSIGMVAASGGLGNAFAAAKGLTGAARAVAIARASRVTALMFGISETGGKYIDLKEGELRATPEKIAKLEILIANAEGEMERKDLQNQLDDLIVYRDSSELAKAVNSTGTGVIAGVAESFGSLGFLRKLNQFGIRPVALRGLQKTMNPLIAKRIGYGLGVIKKGATGIITEEIEEGVTLLGQNAGDNLLGLNKDLSEGLDLDFVLKTGLTSLLIMGPSIGQNVYSQITRDFQTSKLGKKQKSLATDLYQIQEALLDQTLPPKRRRALQQQKLNTLSELALVNGEALVNANNLTKEEFAEVTSIAFQMRELEKEASELGASGDISAWSKKEYKRLKEEHKALSTSKETLLGKSQKEIDEKIKNSPDKVQSSYYFSLYNYSKDIASFIAGEGNYFTVKNKAGLESIIEGNDFSEKDIEEIRSAANDGSNAVRLASGKIVVFEQAVEGAMIAAPNSIEAAIAAVSPMHEIGHAQTEAAGLIEDGDLAGYSDDMVDSILLEIADRKDVGELSEEQYTDVLARVEAYKEINKKRPGKVDADELLQLVGDLINSNILTKNSNVFGTDLKVFTNSLLKKLNGEKSMYFRINTGADAFNFASSWITKAKDNTKVMQAPEEETEAKSSISVKPTVLESINALVPANVTTKAEFQNRKVFNAVYAATEPGGAISNYVRSKSESKEVADKAMESVVDRLINYDPAAVRKKANGDPITFGEFIFANTNFGKLDARKSLAIEAKETARKVSIDSEQAKEIADKDTTIDPRATGKPKRMNLVTRSIVSTEAISKARKTVERAVGALKVTFDKETSLNVTVKPYIAALKKGFAEKELVKAVAQDMGNGGDLKSWMRKHKAAILDNMTTTYLIGAFPAAIQKQVKGTDTWTSDWAGKEIQREKTTTANAGRTSGAFMVRRLPNASSKISDADFIKMLFDSNGVIKPGKKPSLAKAIAEEIGFDILSTEIQNPDGVIAKAFEENQSALGAIVLSNTVATLNKDAERGSAKFSINLSQQKEIANTQDKFLKRALGLNMNLTQKRIAGIMRDVYDPEIFSEEEIVAFSKEAWKDVKRYFDQIKLTENVSLLAFLEEGAGNRKMITNIMLQLGLTKDDIPGGAKALFENKNLVDTQRGLSFDYIAKLIKDEGANGLVKALKFMRGHQTTSGKIGGGRMQIYAGNSDFIENNLNIHDGVEVVWESSKEDGAPRIQSVTYTDSNKVVTVIDKNNLNPPPQSAKPSKETFVKEFSEREAAANEAKEVLLDYLSFVKENGNEVDWFMTMMSLKSNMASMLKAAAAVKYYYEGPAIKALRYEHMLSTEFMAQRLTEHFYIKKIDLNTLFEKYKVAIIPIKMDNNFNVQRQTSAGADFDFNNDPEYKRYYDAATYGYPNMYALEILGGDQKGGTVGRKWVEANKIMAPYAGRVVVENRKSDETINKEAANRVAKRSVNLSKEINDMIERNKGVQSEKVFSAVQAKKRGKTIGKYKFFSPAADDFRGLTSYTFAGKGKQGNADQKFFEDNLIKPYQRGINAIEVAKQTIKNDFAAIVKVFAPQAKIMRNKIPNSDYTYDQAIRVYMWTRQGTEVPGMSKRDLALLNKTVAEDPAMIAFADAMLLVSKQGEWMAPGEHWLTNTVLSDLNNMSEKIGRKVYLEEFLAAKDIIFSLENLAKIEAAYGAKYTSALRDILYRMENGTNRPSGDDATTNRWLNWINQSTGAIMFFNRRSAVLQLLSTVNFLNWSDNNPVKAAMAFANQKQYWTDFAMLFNSPKLKQRRAGLKTDVTQAEIANAVAGQTNKAAAALNYLLKIGFTPTQIADSFAVAAGGASFYRNRVNTYLKQGMSQSEAEALAFEEFSSTADESQQSSDPMLISKQQASVLGRLVLAFQNTTMQYVRLTKKATLDLVNGRGDWRTNVSKIIYYGGVQNFVFSALQSALFSFIPGFGDDDEYDDEKTRKNKLDGATLRIINSMVDSILRGSGLTGAVISTLKNATMKYVEQEEKGYNADHIYTFLSIMSISPPMGSKLSKMYKAQQTKTFEKDALAARPFGVVINGRVNLGPGYRIVGNLAAAAVNLPLDRVVDEVTSISEALDNRNTEWQRFALALGWKSWAVGAKNEEHDLLTAAGKKQRDKDGKAKAAATRAKNKKNKPTTKARRR